MEPAEAKPSGRVPHNKCKEIAFTLVTYVGELWKSSRGIFSDNSEVSMYCICHLVRALLVVIIHHIGSQQSF